MFVAPNEQQAAALRRLRHTEDFKQILAWVENQQQSTITALVGCSEATRIHQLQGSAQTIKAFLRQIDVATS